MLWCSMGVGAVVHLDHLIIPNNSFDAYIQHGYFFMTKVTWDHCSFGVPLADCVPWKLCNWHSKPI